MIELFVFEGLGGPSDRPAGFFVGASLLFGFGLGAGLAFAGFFRTVGSSFGSSSECSGATTSASDFTSSGSVFGDVGAAPMAAAGLFITTMIGFEMPLHSYLPWL